jgi:galactonate dehydratase
MKITTVELTPSADHPPVETVLILGTDSELSGVGEVSRNGHMAKSEAATDALRSVLVGRDLYDLHALVTAGDGRSASLDPELVAAAGTAMADLAGKELGVPVHQLLGGRFRDRVRACAIGWTDGHADLAALTDAARRTVEVGFTALRIEPFAGLDDGAWLLDRGAARVEALRGALPDAVDLIVDARPLVAVDDALAFGSLVRPFEPLWMEVGIPQAALAGSGRSFAVPIAAGRGATSAEHQALAMASTGDHIVLDVGAAGGLIAARRIAALAEIYHIGIVPTGSGRVATVTAVHLAAAIPNLTMVEVRPGFAPLVDGLLPVDGRSGLGVDASGAVTGEVM